MLIILCLVIGVAITVLLTVLGWEILDRWHVHQVRAEGLNIGLGVNDG